MLQQKRFLPAIPLLPLLVPVLACSDPLDLGDPAFIGVIQEVVDQDDRILRFHVDIDKRIAWISSRRYGAWVTVASDTPILVEQPDGSLLLGWLGDLAVGTRVRVWTAGWMTRALTPGVGAERIEILQQEAGQ